MINLIPKNASSCNNTFIVDVTPEMAKTWLIMNNFNRPKRPEVVAQYVRQIREGRWRLTHQGIAFTKDGVLLDGQHRLFAIVECNVTVPIRVSTNEPAENFEVIDCGKIRSNLDTVRMSLKDGTISSAHTGTLKSMLAGRFCKTANRWTNAELNELYQEHIVPVNFSVRQFRNCKDYSVNDPTIRGVIARAYYHVAQSVLETFCSLLIDGGDHPAWSAVYSFLRCLDEYDNRRESTKREIYRRCELTLEAFLTNSNNVCFGKDNKELFPLPSEAR
jgi:hypothetical protein